MNRLDDAGRPARRPAHFLALMTMAMMAIAVTQSPARAGDTGRLRGAAQVIDATRLVIRGRTIILAGIIAPSLQSPCLWKGRRRMNCGRMARAALMDLTAGATVTCGRDAALGGWRCRVGGYDLGEGMIHAGWALPAPSAPPAWRAQGEEARRDRRMLWQARALNGKSFMEILLTRRRQ